MRSSGQFFEDFFAIRRQELGRVLLMSTYLLLIIAAYSTVKAVRDSLFVTQIGPAQLPYVYLLIAGAMGLVSVVYSRAVNRVGLHRLIRITSLFAISNLMLFWVAFRGNSAAWFYVLYVWVSLFGAITASQFWLLSAQLFNPREARRVYTWIGVGGILGGVLGGAMTNRMAHWFGTESLMIVCAAMMAVTLTLLEHVPEAAQEPASRPTRSALFREVKESRHLTMMVLLLGIALIVEAFIDYEYKVVAKQSIASKDQLTAFFGSVTFYIGLFSLLFQTLITNRILKRFGVSWAILLLPVALFVSFFALALRPALRTAALLQLIDGGFSYSIHRSGMELLYLPIPPATRNAVKGFIDTFVDRAGRATGALLLLLFTVGFAFSITALSVVACGLVLAWLVMAIIVRGEYMHSFRRALEKRTIEPEAVQLGHIDGATMETLLKLLSSDDERQVLYALDLLSHSHPDRWRAHIDSLIRHPSGAVRARTIAVLTSWNDPAIARDEFTQHPDYETARIATASLLRLHWNNLRTNRELLHSLLTDSSPAVVREAFATAASVGFQESVPLLIEKLGDRRLRSDARQALLRFGDSVIPELVRRLADPAADPSIRRRVPKTLALMGKQNAADALIRHMHQLDYHLDYAILKALNRIRVNSPGIEIDRNRVGDAIQKEISEHEMLVAVHAACAANRLNHQVFVLLMRALEERRKHRIERIFRLVGLIYSPQDIYSVYYTCLIKPALGPSAIEFLDNILDAELKEAVVPLLEGLCDPQQERGRRREVEKISLSAALSVLVAGDDPWLEKIADDLQKQIGEKRAERREHRVISN